MKGDYYLYLAVFKVTDERKEATEATMEAYKAAQVNQSASPHGKNIKP